MLAPDSENLLTYSLMSLKDKKCIACWSSPIFMRRFHYFMTVMFAVLIPVSLVTGLKESISFLVFLSLWALVASHWSAAEATKAEQAARSDVPDP